MNQRHVFFAFFLVAVSGMAWGGALSQQEAAVPSVLGEAAPRQVDAGMWFVEHAGLVNFDRAGMVEAKPGSVVPKNYSGRQRRSLYDLSQGKPTFLWAKNDVGLPASGPLPVRQFLIERAREYLRSEAQSLGLTLSMIEDAKVVDAQFNGAGAAVVRFVQQFGEHEVYQRTLNVLLDRQIQPVAVSGYFATNDDVVNGTQPLAFVLNEAQAIARSWKNLGGVLEASQISLHSQNAEYQYFRVANLVGSHVLEREPRVKQVYYPMGNALMPAYYVELLARARVNGQLVAYSLVVSGLDGLVLNRQNLKSNATYSYRVFAEPDGDLQPFDSPLGNGYTPFPGINPTDMLDRNAVSSNLVTLEHAGLSTGDPWLPSGAGATTGNNVDACLDAFDTPISGITSNPLNICTPLLGDLRAVPNDERTFDYQVLADEDPSSQIAQNAAVVNLFYINNWLHDWWYDHGFNEEAGNAQSDNYGRGGKEGDPLLAQAQDASGRNNANMVVPADGSSPIMQQYLFDGLTRGTVRQLTPKQGPSLVFVGAAFGPDDYELQADLVVADETGGDNPRDGCGLVLPDPGLPIPLPALPAPPQSNLAGKIALIERGGCSFTIKAQFAMLSGAAAMIVINNNDAEPIAMGNGDIPITGVPLPISPTDPLYQIPSVMIRKSDGDELKDQLMLGAVTMHMDRVPSTDVDGTLDNQIVAHEYFHYVHNRLTNSNTQQARAMSEGWGDVSALMLSLRENDRQLPGNERYQGAYGLSGYVTNNFYAGIRRAPYSSDFGTNAFTFKHIANGEPTPIGGNGENNAEIHNAGEIWANAVFECYLGILSNPNHHFKQARNRMKDYIIAGLKMTPTNATFTEGRDAILAAAWAVDAEDYTACAAGFSKRGMGPGAVSPDRFSIDMIGVVEDFSSFECAVDVTATCEELYSGASGFSAEARGGSPSPWLLLISGLLAMYRRKLTEQIPDPS